MIRTRVILAALALLPAYPLHLRAQGSGEVELPRLHGAIRLDGVLDDAAWNDAMPLPMTMYFPTFRGTPSESSEVRVAYDDTYLYAYGRFRDSHPLRINSLYRDRYSSDDAFGFYLDTFNDNENGVWLIATPAGTRIDNSISADGNVTDVSWNAPWDVATQVTAEGWTMEMRIPLSSLRFEVRDGRTVMGLLVTRLMPRTNERVTYPAVESQTNFRQPSIFQDVVLRDVSPHRPAYLTPYVLGGSDRRMILPSGGSAFAREQSAVHEAGADLRYAVSDNLNLDLSANTDFAQVEADDEVANLTRFPLFFPEKRQFFQERAGVFAFDLGNGGRLFHSRNIGLAPDRTPIRILGGGRVVARQGAWDLGVLDMQTARRDSFPTENLGVLRLRRRIFNQNSYTGMILTSRRDDAGHYNTGLGWDASVRVFGSDYFTFRGASTFDQAQANPGLLDRSTIFARWERRGANGLTYFAGLNRAGGQYMPDLGFLPRTNFTRGELYVQYNPVVPGNHRIRSHGPGAIIFGWFGNTTHQLETAYGAYWWLYEFRSGANGFFEVIHNYENTPGFSLGDNVSVPSGVYRFVTLWFNYVPPPGNRIRTGFDARAGGFYDGSQVQLTFTPTWNASRHLEIGGRYQLNLLRFDDRNTKLDVHVAQLRVGVAKDAKLSTVAIAQYNSVSDRLSLNLRVRYNVAEGRDLWLVWDEGINTDLEDHPASVPTLPRSDSRQLRLKATWMLSL